MGERMKVLVACEESQTVCKAFRKRGHEAYSCDVQECSGGHPEWHIHDDVLKHLDDGWDLMIAHPPCTNICRNAARWIESENRYCDLIDGTKFFNILFKSDIEKICIENPIPSLKTREYIGKYDQIIQPWQFGHDYSKKTALWLKNLPELKPTKIIEITYYTTPNGKKFTKGWYFTPRNSLARSKTFPGIAQAMAEQWGCLDE